MLLASLLMLAGCHAHISIDKRPSIGIPILDEGGHTNSVVVLDQGYVVRYAKWGFNTEVQNMAIEITTNRTVKVDIGELNSVSSITNFTLHLDELLDAVQMFREAERDAEFSK